VRGDGLDLLVMPEALLGGYPKGADFGVRVGYRTPAGREMFRRYWEQAIDIPGPETDALCDFARHAGAALVAGVIERDGATLFCSALLVSAAGDIEGVHRKVMPTAAERLIWGQGGASGLVTMQTPVGCVAPAICWENYMPLYRAAMYARQPYVWCAPTVDDREIWQASMRHIAYEARCFLVSSCQYSPNTVQVLGSDITLRDRPVEKALIQGGSCIISPLGEILAGPIVDREALIVAEIDPADIVRARFDFDVAGHYTRPDLFLLQTSEDAGPPNPRGQDD
jgi:nitrilase